jgi:SWI/SNF-related matrix-associated actin-dependent regulator 1 of chromatin subfamily A
VNKPKDLLSQLGIIGQAEHFGNYKGFIARYCDGYDGASNLKELNWMLNKHCFYRREKKSVLKDLPDKMRQIVLCDISNRKEYAAALANLESYLKEFKNAPDEKIASAMRGESLALIQALKNISARGKLDDVCEQIQDVMEQGEKLVVFTHLTEVGSEIIRRFPGALSIRGMNTEQERQSSVDRFQNDPTAQLIVCGIKSGGVGITLTAASRVAFVELPWHAADCDQCEDRCHRIGQHDSVQCTYFLGKDTIDEDIYKIIEGKREVSDAVTGATGSIETAVIDIMMSSLFNKKRTQEGSLL